MTYCANLIGSLFYLLKKIPNLATCLFFFSLYLFFEFQDFLGTLLFNNSFVSLDFSGTLFLIFDSIFWVFLVFPFFIYQLPFENFFDALLCDMECVTFDFPYLVLWIVFTVVSLFNCIFSFLDHHIFFLRHPSFSAAFLTIKRALFRIF